MNCRKFHNLIKFYLSLPSSTVQDPYSQKLSQIYSQNFDLKTFSRKKTPLFTNFGVTTFTQNLMRVLRGRVVNVMHLALKLYSPLSA